MLNYEKGHEVRYCAEVLTEAVIFSEYWPITREEPGRTCTCALIGSSTQRCRSAEGSRNNNQFSSERARALINEVLCRAVTSGATLGVKACWRRVSRTLQSKVLIKCVIAPASKELRTVPSATTRSARRNKNLSCFHFVCQTLETSFKPTQQLIFMFS